MERKCLVLHESVSREDVGYAGYETSWGFSEAIKNCEGVVREVIYREVRHPGGIRENFVHYLTEKVRNLPYLIVYGESITDVMNDVCTSLPVLTREEIIRMVQASEGNETYLKGIIYLGLQGKFKECDAETLGLFKQVLQDQNPEVRNTAIVAMSYTGWPELRELVQPLAETDPDPQVRQTASQFLSGVELP
jgi:HEAT repeats